ncbi:HNH endonuclease signature motif containing protein [Brevibacterium litoralis]|uniref:HNH endonuclease signature motif containing protein n=1 Tax=Brevibacterium litoralis TaxID=3138935 RepID=UPI0032EDB642
MTATTDDTTHGTTGVRADDSAPRSRNGRAAARHRLSVLKDQAAAFDRAGLERMRTIADYLLAEVVVFGEEDPDSCLGATGTAGADDSTTTDSTGRAGSTPAGESEAPVDPTTRRVGRPRHASRQDLADWTGQVETITDVLERWEKAAATLDAAEKAAETAKTAHQAWLAAEATIEAVLAEETVCEERVAVAREAFKVTLAAHFVASTYVAGEAEYLSAVAATTVPTHAEAVCALTTVMTREADHASTAFGAWTYSFWVPAPGHDSGVTEEDLFERFGTDEDWADEEGPDEDLPGEDRDGRAGEDSDDVADQGSVDVRDGVGDSAAGDESDESGEDVEAGGVEWVPPASWGSFVRREAQRWWTGVSGTYLDLFTDPAPRLVEPLPQTIGEARAVLEDAESQRVQVLCRLGQIQDALDVAQETARDAERSRKEAEAAATAGPAAGARAFPHLHVSQSLVDWVKAHVDVVDLTHLAGQLRLTDRVCTSLAYSSLTLVHGLPRFFARAIAGEFSFSQVEAAGQMCKTLPAGVLREVDDYLAGRRAEVSLETFRKTVREMIATVQTPEDRAVKAHRSRNVRFQPNPDGSASLVFTADLERVFAWKRRLEATGVAILKSDTATFAEVPEGRRIADDRTLGALMFDLAEGAVPQTEVRTIPTADTGDLMDPTDGVTATIGDDTSGGAGVPGDSTDDSAGDSTGEDSGEDDAEDATEPEDTEAEECVRWVRVLMPATRDFLSQQAAVLVTVPALTLTGHGDLPGLLPDGSPVPAQMARRIAAGCTTWMRILTDPATGTPLDARARTYRVSRDVRVAVGARWQMCTAPGCTRRAYRCEIDHVEPFDLGDPCRGGLTVFGNLHPLCKRHHQAKTDRRCGVSTRVDGARVWEFEYQETFAVHPPDRPIDAAHAEAMRNLDTDPETGSEDGSGTSVSVDGTGVSTTPDEAPAGSAATTDTMTSSTDATTAWVDPWKCPQLDPDDPDAWGSSGPPPF